MRNKLAGLLFVLFFAFFLAHQCDKASQREQAKEAEQPKEEIHCMVCSKDLTNDYNRIAPNGNGYYCTPCYKQTMREVHENIQAEGYD